MRIPDDGLPEERGDRQSRRRLYNEAQRNRRPVAWSMLGVGAIRDWPGCVQRHATAVRAPIAFSGTLPPSKAADVSLRTTSRTRLAHSQRLRASIRKVQAARATLRSGLPGPRIEPIASMIPEGTSSSGHSTSRRLAFDRQGGEAFHAPFADPRDGASDNLRNGVWSPPSGALPSLPSGRSSPTRTRARSIAIVRSAALANMLGVRREDWLGFVEGAQGYSLRQARHPRRRTDR